MYYEILMKQHVFCSYEAALEFVLSGTQKRLSQLCINSRWSRFDQEEFKLKLQLLTLKKSLALARKNVLDVVFRRFDDISVPTHINMSAKQKHVSFLR